MFVMAELVLADCPRCPSDTPYYMYINDTCECYAQCPPDAPFIWGNRC